MKKYIYLIAIVFTVNSCSQDAALSEGIASNSEVLSGSYANMLTLGNFLYVLGNGQLKTLSLSDPANPELLDEQDINFGVESLFITGQNLFVGSQEGMFIYTIGEDGIPAFRSETNYDNFDAFSCFLDPVTANEDYAYVTLDNDSSVETCWRPALDDQMRIFDLEDLENPVLVNTIFMNNPKGIALDGEYLFVCEKVNGLSAFELTNPIEPELIYKSEDFSAFDLIPAGGLLMVVGQDTIHQFDYTDIDNISKIGEYSLRD